MVELAEKVVSLNPGLDWCVFAKNGNDVTTLAVTVARAATGKKNILVQPKGKKCLLLPICFPLAFYPL